MLPDKPVNLVFNIVMSVFLKPVQQAKGMPYPPLLYHQTYRVYNRLFIIKSKQT